MKNDRRALLGEITAKFNEYRNRRVSTRTVRRKLKLHNLRWGIHRKRVVMKKVNRKNRVSWCMGKRWRNVNNFWKNVIYVWRKTEEGWRPDLIKRQEQCPVKVMVWGLICFNGVGTLCKVVGNINAQKYIDILEDNIWPMIARHFPRNNYLFQDDNAPVLCNQWTEMHELALSISGLEYY